MPGPGQQSRVQDATLHEFKGEALRDQGEALGDLNQPRERSAAKICADEIVANMNVVEKQEATHSKSATRMMLGTGRPPTKSTGKARQPARKGT